MNRRLLILLLFIQSAAPICAAQDSIVPAEISAQVLLRHIKYLASPELGGRLSGHQGNRLAARYIAAQFESYGLAPAGDSGGYFQNFTIGQTPRSYDSSAVLIKFPPRGATRLWTLQPEMQFRPFYSTVDADTVGTPVFVGYGLRAAELGYDDYSGVDVNGKIVVIMRGTPDGEFGNGPFMRYEPLSLKLAAAGQLGAIAVIVVCGPLDANGKQMQQFWFDQGMPSCNMPTLNMSIGAVDTLFQRYGKNLHDLQQAINSSKHPASFALPGSAIRVKIVMSNSSTGTANVAAVLRGSDPKLANEYIVIGAHFDHIGLGGMFSTRPDTSAIHPGADDNGSGTAGLLEMARYLSVRRNQLRRSVLFLAFSGEEEGLLGSQFYVEHPLVPLDNTIAMLNLDMIGRLRGDSLTLEGMTSSPDWARHVRGESMATTFTILWAKRISGSSDQYPFFKSHIPVLFFFTGLHDDYHSPADTWDKINYPGEERIVQFAARIVTDIDQNDTPPEFVQRQDAPFPYRRPWIAPLAELSVFFTWYCLFLNSFINRKRTKT